MSGNHSAHRHPLDQHLGHHHGDGNYDHDHHHHGHDHHHNGPTGTIFYPRPHARSRRAFLGNFGKGMAMAVITPAVLAACSSGSDSTPSAQVTTDDAVADPTQAPAATSAPADPTAVPENTPAGEAESGEAESGEAESGEAESGEAESGEASAGSDLIWARSNLGFVSAYVLVRGNSAAIVDTGTAGSAAAIGMTLNELGLNYSNVEHVILTHNHSDHAGAISEVLAGAVNATAYAGEADLGSLPTDLTGLVGGEDIFGFQMVPTPGHTPGHMVAYDEQASLLIAGDALFTEGGGVVEGPERFFDDIPQSRESIRAMAALTFNTLLVGHGDPLESGADAAVAALAASF